MRRDLDDVQRRLGHIDDMAGKGHSSLRRMFEVGGGILLVNVLENATTKLSAFVRESVQAAARVEEMDKVLSVLGKNSGYNTTQIDEQTKAIKGLGIQTSVAQESLSQFLKFNLDLQKAGDLARVAQDVAVIGGSDSSQTLQSLLWGITTRQPEIIRRAGLTVNFEQEFARVAAERGKAVSALTENEKIQASLNAVIREGAAVEGAYEKSMESASKQLRSRERYVEELKETLGGMFTPMWSAQVFAGNDIIKWATEVFEADGSIAKAVRSGTTAMATSFNDFWLKVERGFRSAQRTGAIEEFGDRLQQVVNTMRANAGVITAISTSAGLMGLGRLLGVGGMLGGALSTGPGSVIGVLIGAYQASAKLRDAIGGLVSEFVSGFGLIGNSSGPVMDALQDALKAIGDLFAEVVEAVTPLIDPVAEVAAAFLRVVTVAVQLVAAIMPLVTWVANLVSSLLEIKPVGLAIVGILIAIKAASLGALAAGAFEKMVAGWHAVAAAAGRAKAATVAVPAPGVQRGAWGFTGTATGGAAAPTAAKFSGAALLGSVASSVAPILAITAALGALTFAINKVSEAQEAARKSALDYAEDVKRQVGGEAIPAIARLSDEYNKAVEVRDALLAAPTQWGPGGNYVPGLGAAVPGAGEAAVAADDAKMRLKEALKEWAPDIATEATERFSTLKDQLQAISDQSEILSTALSLPVLEYSEVLDLLPSQQKIIGDFLSQLVQDTKSWRDQLVSIPGAAKDAAEAFSKAHEGATGVASAQGISSQLAVNAAQAQTFMSNLGRLQELGAGTTIIQQYLKKGPEEAGKALGQVMTELEAMGEAKAKAVIETWNRNIASIGQSIDAGLQQLAVDLMEGDLKMDTPEQVAEMVRQLQDLRASIQPAIDDFNTTLATGILPEGVTGRIKALGDEMQAAVAAGDQTGASGYAEMIRQYVSMVKTTGSLSDEQKELLTALAENASAFAAGGVSLADLESKYWEFVGVTAEGVVSLQNFKKAIAEVDIAIAGTQAMVAKLLREGMDPSQAIAWGKRVLDGFNVSKTALKQGMQSIVEESTEMAKGASPYSDAIAKTQTELDKLNSATTDNAAANKTASNSAKAQKDAVDELRNAYDKVYGIISNSQQAVHDLASAKDSMSSTIGTAVLSHKSEAETLRQVEQQAASAAQAVRDQAFAMAEAGQIGRDTGSINAFIAQGLDQLTSEVEANVQAWIAEKGELIEVNALMEEIGKTWGRSMNALKAGNASVRSVDDALKTIYSSARMVKPTLAETEYGHMAVQESVLSAMEAIRAEAQAMAEAGMIGKDWTSITEYMTDRLLDLRNEVTGLTSDWADQSKQLEDIDAQLSRVRKGYEEYLDVFINQASAAYSSRDAMRSLAQLYKDNTAALSGYNTNAEERDILSNQLKQGLNTVVMSIRAEAEAMAKAGKLGSDAASQHKFLTDRLIQMKAQFPELATLIDEYLGHIGNIPEDAKTEADFAKDMAAKLVDDYMAKLNAIPKNKDTEARAYVDAAIATIQSYRSAMEAWIPQVWTTYMRVEVDQASLQNAANQLSSIGAQTDAMQQRLNELMKVEELYNKVIAALKAGNDIAAAAFYNQYAAQANSTGQAAASWDIMQWNAGRKVKFPTFAEGALLGPRGEGVYRFAESASAGESLIPWSLYNRARGEQLLSFTAMKFGGRFSKGDSPAIGGDTTEIGELHVHSDAPPRVWLEEAAWQVRLEAGL